jgi:hypothetical protein
MAQFEYRTLIYGTPDPLRRWVIAAPDALAVSQQVGAAEKSRFVGRVWQGMRLLETALRELDADGWELVSASFSGILSFYGCAVLKRPVAK